MKYLTMVGDQKYEIEIKGDAVYINGEARFIDFRLGSGSIFSLLIDNQSFEAVVELRGDRYHVLMRGDLYEVEVTDERAQRLLQAKVDFQSQSGESIIRAPMPGLVVAVPVSEGEEVKKGQTVIILESMKMQNELKATRDGVIGGVSVQPGESVEQNRVLVRIQ